MIALALIVLFAAFVNGALGYGFSSLTVPLALVFLTNRVLNPAIVLVEVIINIYVLLINLKGVPSVWRRVQGSILRPPPMGFRPQPTNGACLPDSRGRRCRQATRCPRRRSHWVGGCSSKLACPYPADTRAQVVIGLSLPLPTAVHTPWVQPGRR